jgi:MscS family membrane protein
MLGNGSRRLRSCILLLVLWSSVASATDTSHPLEPLDLSSPRATLNSLLTTGDAYFRLARDEHWRTPSRAIADRLHVMGVEAERTLDLSEVPPAARFEIGRDAFIYLYEVLSRIELPPTADIPDAVVYADADEGGADDKPASWTIPHTEITIARVAQGPRAGEFLFDSETVVRAREFYEKTSALPYLRDVPLKYFAEKRAYLSIASGIIAPHTIEGLPNWLKRSVSGQAVWKLLGLVILAAVSVLVIWLIHRLARRVLPGKPATVHLQRLVIPLTLLLLTPLVFDVGHRELTLTGWMSTGLTLFGFAVAYFSLAWIAWTGSLALANAVIASPKISDKSLNAHLLRLTARIVGIVAVITIIFYVSNQLGVPLFGLIAGLGVGGIAIALAAQNTIEHFIGSLNLFADQPVRVGDLCRYGEDSTPDWQRMGTVESIGLRSTRIRGIDDTVTTIPNGDFSRMHLVNYSLRKCTLLLTVLGLRYETTDDQLRYVLVSLRELLLSHPRVSDEEPRVRFSGFDDYSLKVEVRVNINTADPNEFRAIREDIYLHFMKIVKDAGTGFALPSRTIYHTRDEGLDGEHQQTSEAQVRAWCAAQELPFPTFTAGYREKVRNTLDYPPEGSPEGRIQK